MARGIRIGLVGYKFMGKAHSNAYLNVARFFDLPKPPVMRAICGRSEAAVRAAVAAGEHDEAVKLLATIRPAVDKFFDEVMVMCDDKRLRSNRLALMQLLADLFLSFADFTRLRGEEEYE